MDVIIDRQLRLVGCSTIRIQTGLGIFREIQESLFREDEPSHRYSQHLLRIR